MWELSRLDPDSAEFRAGFAQMLREYGSRGPNEWDIYSEVWETKPQLALALIDSMRAVGPEGEPRKRLAAQVADREAATAEALAAVEGNAEATGMVLAAQASALRFNAWRERSKTNCIKVIHEQRMALRELGGRHLADARDIFTLTDDELDGFVADPAAAHAVIAERKAAWQQLWLLEPPYFVESDKGIPAIETLISRSNSDAVVANAGDVLTGAGGCSGVVRGRARVILDAGDPSALEPGDILVAPNTDPSWTPLFVAAGGAVVNVGAMNSHAIIVSRELGIPCVVSVTDATKRIVDGSMIEVNGDAGTVTIL
jgi:rifampicin phosphotransferase